MSVTDLSAVVVFPNLTLNVSEDGVCLECNREIQILIESVFDNPISNNSQLMNASIVYSTAQTMVRVFAANEVFNC